jgi:hypothetical protein
MRRIQRLFDGRTFALAVFLAVYVGLLAIAFAPRDGIGAAPNDLASGTVRAAAGSHLIALR